MGSELAQKIETRVSAQVRLFLGEVRKLSLERGQEAAKNWEDYKPELMKSESKEVAGRLVVSFFERTLRSVKDELEAVDFHRLKYDTVGKMMKCTYALGVHKNATKDYVKHLHAIEGKPLERGIRMADEKPWETPDEVEKRAPRKPITVDELKKRITGDVPRRFDAELFAAGAFAVAALTLFLVKLLG